MVDIIIINWNSGDYLSTCVNSIIHTQNENFINTLYIIDNNSSDTSLENVPSDNKIKIIRNTTNIGFSKACNQGFKLCTSHYALLLNPDIRLQNDTIEKCITFMNDHNDIDILGCQLLDDQSQITYSCARFPTPLWYFFDAVGLSKIAPSIFHPALLMTDWDHNESKKVDQVIGAFMFMRAAVFEKLGYFDERFFVYYEELDFSKRLADFGGCSFFNCNIKAFHSGEGTTKNVKPFRLFLNLRSRLLYAKKHFSTYGYRIVWVCTFIIEPFSRTIFSLLRGNFNEPKSIFKAYNLLVKESNKSLPE
jgi:GT2 family glycosyltransferase